MLKTESRAVTSVFVPAPTPTQAAAAKRHRLFRRKIEERAARIRKAQPSPVHPIIPETPELSPDPPIAVYPIGRESLEHPADLSIPVFPVIPKQYPPTLTHPMAIAIIQRLVAEYFEVAVAALKGPRRQIHIVIARHIAIYLCRELTPLSFPLIAEQFGYRDHTTAMHAYAKIKTCMLNDPNLAHRIAFLTGILTSAQQ